MRRMIDAKKLKEIEESGGTKWYKHDVSISNPAMPAMTVSIELISMISGSLKDIELPNGNFVAIMTAAGGPSAPNPDNSFPVISNSGGTFTLRYLSTDGSIQRYQFNKSSIKSDEVTQL